MHTMMDGSLPGSGVPAVYAAVAAVMAEMGRDGIAKDRRNQQQGYNFRGIDDVYNALSSVLSKHGLIIVPRVLSRECAERTSEKGKPLFYVVVHVEFEIVSTADGSRMVAATWGEAMDSADKATNKAMSAAYKYMAFQTFCIPTEGDNDADASAPELAPARAASAPPPRPTLPKADARPEYAEMIKEIRASTSEADLKDWGRRAATRIDALPADWKAQLREEYARMLADHREFAARNAAPEEEGMVL